MSSARARAGVLGGLLWLVFLVGVTAVVVRENERRSVTPNYRRAAEAWSAGRDMYGEGIHGFLYLPSSAVLYTPFTWPPDPWGGVAWRWAGVAVLASGIWRLAGLTGGGSGPRFLLMTLLTLPTLAGSARNGQMNVPMAGFMAHAAVDLARARWWGSAVSLALGVALKPTVLPMAMLAAALYPPAAWRIAVLLLAVIALPLATGDPAYVRGQYAAFVVKMRMAGAPPPGRWQDLTGLVRAVGYEPPAALMTGLRLLAAPVTLAGGWLALRRLGPLGGAVALWTLGAGYILLWNPRTEGVTYLILVPGVALLASWALEADRRSAAGWLCVAIAVVLGVSHLLTPGKWNTWMRPAAALVFMGYVLGLVARGEASGARPVARLHP